MQCPLLCKEFIIDAWQIYYARCKGADAILLIAAVLPDLDIKYLTKICGMLGLAALVEVCYISTAVFCAYCFCLLHLIKQCKHYSSLECKSRTRNKKYSSIIILLLYSCYKDILFKVNPVITFRCMTKGKWTVCWA